MRMSARSTPVASWRLARDARCGQSGAILGATRGRFQAVSVQCCPFTRADSECRNLREVMETLARCAQKQWWPQRDLVVRLVLWTSHSRDWLLLANPVSRLQKPVAGRTLPAPYPVARSGGFWVSGPVSPGRRTLGCPELMAFVAALRAPVARLRDIRSGNERAGRHPRGAFQSAPALRLVAGEAVRTPDRVAHRPARCRPRGRGGGGPHDLGCHRRRAHRAPPGQSGWHARGSLRPHRHSRSAPREGACTFPRTARWSCRWCRRSRRPPLGLPAHTLSALPTGGAVLRDARTEAALESPRS